MTARTEGIDELALPDLERRTANAIRYGRIMAVDYANARVRVKSCEIESAWLPWSTGRASGAKRRWDPPEVGEQVVMLSPGGDMRQAVVLTGVFQQSAGAPSASPTKDTTVYGDGAVIEYDRGSHTHLVDVPAGGKILLRCGASSIEISDSGVKITAPRIDLN